MSTVQLVITESNAAVPKILYGLKINEDTLQIKQKSIDEIPTLLGIIGSYVIGYDSYLSKTQQPHYHIHWSDTRTLAAMQKAKQRIMPDWGRTTKLYQAKIKEGADPYAWYGYACKEKIVITSYDLDLNQIKMHAHTQAEFKKSQINYVEHKEKKVKAKLTFEEELFQHLDTYLALTDFAQVCACIVTWVHQVHNKWITKTPLEMHAWKWCVSRGKFTYDMYARHLIGDRYNSDEYKFV